MSTATADSTAASATTAYQNAEAAVVTAEAQAASLRTQAVTDATITGSQIANADANVELARIRAHAAKATMVDAQTADKVAHIGALADSLTTAIDGQSANVAAAAATAESALMNLVSLLNTVDATVGDARDQLDLVADPDLSPRATRDFGGWSVDGHRLRPVTGTAWLAAVVKPAFTARYLANGDEDGARAVNVVDLLERLLAEGPLHPRKV